MTPCPACDQEPCVCAPAHSETEKLLRETIADLEREEAAKTDTPKEST